MARRIGSGGRRKGDSMIYGYNQVTGKEISYDSVKA